jgi:hypothetical protein
MGTPTRVIFTTLSVLPVLLTSTVNSNVEPGAAVVLLPPTTFISKEWSGAMVMIGWGTKVVASTTRPRAEDDGPLVDLGDVVQGAGCFRPSRNTSMANRNQPS